MPWIFGITMFVSATLLFLVQPMVGKMILPLLGGTPAVWNSCMVFFQALLLAGYFYAHKLSLSNNAGRQTLIHMAVLGLAVAVLAIGATLSEDHSPVPVVKSLAPQGSDMPFFGVIALLAAAIGLPFFTVSTTAPLLQKWFAETGHPAAKDPYFLYAASNAGSLLALFAYPAVIEPFFRLIDQAWIWAIGFVILTVMLVICGRTLTAAKLATANREQSQTPQQRQENSLSANSQPAPTLWDWIRWPILAAVPSSLMLSVTTEIVTDVISTPLIWIVPLALYLITFIIVFAKSTPKSVHTLMTLSAPVLILLMVFLKTSGVSPKPEWISFALRVLCFFVVTMVCHGELARTRPSSKYLTAFYLSMSFGGMLGGLFNAFVAPVFFVHVSEYPISLVAACLVLPPLSQVLRTLNNEPTSVATQIKSSWRTKIESYWYIVAPFLIFILVRVLTMFYPEINSWISRRIDEADVRADERSLARILIYGVPALLCYLLIERPRVFGLSVAAFWAASFLTDWKQENRKRTPEELDQTRYVFLHTGEFYIDEPGVGTTRWPYFSTNIEMPVIDVIPKVHYSRSFFGTMKVERGAINTRLVHGTTLHGMQCRWTKELEMAAATKLLTPTHPLEVAVLQTTLHHTTEGFGRERPLTYYHRTGPVGDMFRVFRQKVRENPNTNTSVACIGLGTGSLSTYGEPNEKMTFFEIDQHVKDLVEPPEHFTYLADAKRRGVPMEFEMGDARLTLERSNKKWGFMLVDAFSSDAIPAHLLTIESIKLYLDRVEDDAIVALHISNRYLDLEPVVEKIVQELGIAARVRHDYDQMPIGKTASTWIAISRKLENLGPLLEDKNWDELASRSDVSLWSDDFTPLLNVLKPEYLRWLPGERQMIRPKTMRIGIPSSPESK